jgi:signal transduction histidine kinase/ActR/RegA family two-component response regulator
MIRLRTKFFCTLLAISAGLTGGTLLIVRNAVQTRMREAIRDDLQTSVKTFELLELQRQESLRRSAEFIAALPTVRAVMTTRDIPTIQDAARGLIRQSGADALILADRMGAISAIQTKDSNLDVDHAQALLVETFKKGDAHDWWVTNGRLYEVQVQPIEFGEFPKQTTIGILILGNEITSTVAKAFGSVAGSEAVFRSGGVQIASTFPADKNPELWRLQSVQATRLGSDPFEVQIGEEKFLASGLRISNAQGVGVDLFVVKSLDKATDFLDSLNRLLIALGGVTLLAGGMLGFLMADNFTKPLSRLVAGVKALEEGDYEYPVGTPGKDEVGTVTNTFLKMRSRLQNVQKEQKELEGRLRQAHKMEAVGRLAGGVAHDFNNLLTIICGHSDLIADRVGNDEKLKQNVEQIRKASGRAVGMTRQLLAFSRMQVLQPRIVDLNAIITDMSKMLPRLIGEHIEYSFEGDPELFHVQADPGQIEQVLMNLAVNARDAMPQGGKLHVRTCNAILSEEDAAKRPAMSAGEYAQISVTDTGCGMDEQTKAHIFEPFFTTKDRGKGTGLGLATVYGIVKQSGGFIWVESSVEKGTTFDIHLPHSNEPASAPASERVRQEAVRGTGTILIAEDEAGVRELASKALRSAGYQVLEAQDGIEALRVAESHAGTIELLLTDVVMPRLSGKELADALKRKRPGIQVLLITGYSEYSHGKHDADGVDGNLLQKPFSLEALTAKVREVLEERPALEPKGSEEPGA